MNNRPTINPEKVLISVPLINDDAELSFIEAGRHCPFPIQRVYWISKALDEIRGKHAHHQTVQILFCLSGSVTINLDNGQEKTSLNLTTQNQGVLLEPLVWHEMSRFTNETVLMVLASAPFNEADYIRDYSEFKKIVGEKYDLNE